MKNVNKMGISIILIIMGLVYLPAQSILINEIQSSNENTLKDEDGDYSDWFELYNTGEDLVNLKDFGITDDPKDKFQWVFPEISINAKEHLLIFASGKDRVNVYNHYETVIREGDLWNYRVNTSEVVGDWKDINFDDSSWESGPTGIGYGDGDDDSVYVTIYNSKGEILNNWPKSIYTASYYTWFGQFLSVDDLNNDDKLEIIFNDYGEISNQKIYAYNVNGNIEKSFGKSLSGKTFKTNEVVSIFSPSLRNNCIVDVPNQFFSGLIDNKSRVTSNSIEEVSLFAKTEVTFQSRYEEAILMVFTSSSFMTKSAILNRSTD